MDLAERIAALPDATKRARLLDRLHQRDAAPQIGITPADLSRFERGELDVRMSTLIKIARWVDARDAAFAAHQAEWMASLGALILEEPTDV